MRFGGKDVATMSRAERIELRDVLAEQMTSPRAPLHARRWARDRLAQLARAGGVTMSDRPGGFVPRAREAPAVPPRVPPRRDSRAVADRAADARTFLYGQQDAATAERVESARDALRIPGAATDVQREQARAFRETPSAGSTESDPFGVKDGRDVQQRVADAQEFLRVPRPGERR